MTPTDSQNDSPEPAAEEPKPEGLVEELRQEARELREEAREITEEIGHAVEEVVEHVPKPVRWTVGKLVWISALAFVGLIVLALVSTALYLANHTELVARELTLVVNGVIGQRSNLQIEVKDLKGNPFQHVRLIQPRVRFTGRDGPVLLEAPWMEFRNLPFGMLVPGRQEIEVVIESPTIHVRRGADGKLRLPEWRGGPSRPGQAGKSRNLVANLVLRGGTIEIDGLDSIQGLTVEAEATTTPGRVVLRKLAWVRGPWDTRDVEVTGEMLAGDSVRVRIQRLHTADLDLRATAAWKPGQSERVVHAEIDRVTWRWLSRATGNRTLDVPGSGRAVVDGRGSEEWNGQFTSELEWNGLAAKGGGELHWAAGRLSLVPLNVESAAGRLDGDVAWSKQSWEVGGEVENGDPEQWKSIGIVGWPKGRVQGAFRYVVDTRTRVPSAELTATLGPSELSGWRADQGTVEVHFRAVGADSFWVHTERRSGTLELIGAATGSGWQGSFRAEKLPLDEWPEGRASGIRGTLVQGAGTVAGVPGALHVSGKLEGAETDWLGIHAARWRLEQLDGRMLPTPDLRTLAHLDDVTFLGVHFDSVRSPLALGDATLAITALEASASDSVLTCSGSTRWSDQGWRLELEPARLRSSSFDWRARGPVILSGNPRGVDFERFEAQDGEAAVTAAGRWAGPGGSYEWRARASGLDLSRLGLPPEIQLTGRADVALDIDGVSGDPRWRLAAEVSRPGYQGHRGDTLAFGLAGAPGEVSVERSHFGLGAGRIMTTGAFHRMQPIWPDTLQVPAIQRWLLGAATCEGEVRVERFPLGRLAGIAPVARDWSGAAGGRLRLNGSPGAPVIDLEIDGEPVAWRGLGFDDVRVRARYAGGTFEVREGQATRGGLQSSVHGRIPMRVRLGAPIEIPEEPMQWRADIPTGDLAMLGRIIPQIGAMSGKFTLHADVAGTPRHPDLDGVMAIRDGRMRMAGREEVVEDLSARIRLDESRVTVDSLVARQGRRGRVTGSGVAEFVEGRLQGYRFDLDLKEVAAIETGVYAALFDGQMRVTDGPTVNGQMLPFVSGHIDIRQAAIQYNFVSVSEAEAVAQTVQPLYWTYRLQVRANNNVHWEPPEGDIEFSVNLDVEQTPAQLILFGEMHAIRGTYWFLSNRFRVQRADLSFDHLTGVDPVIDAEATTQIADTTKTEVTVLLSGRASEPTIRFESDPPKDEAMILRDLTLGVETGVATTIGDPVDNYLTRAVNRTLSEEMSRVFQGYISEWELERERGGLLAGEGDVILGVGTQVTPQLSLRYRERIPGTGRAVGADLEEELFNRDIEAEYRVSRLIYITSGVRQRRSSSLTTGSTVGTDFNVNLKARWEY